MDGLTISSGGAIDVDTELLRHAAARLESASTTVLDAGRRLAQAASWERDACLTVVSGTNVGVQGSVDRLNTDMSAIATSLREIADLYELTELILVARARGAGTVPPAVSARIRTLLGGDPRRLIAAEQLIASWRGRVGTAIRDQVDGAILGHTLPLAAPLMAVLGIGFPVMIGGLMLLNRGAFAVARGAVRHVDQGTVARGERLMGPMPTVTVTELERREGSSAPRSLADVVERIPGDGDTRVVVEKYSAPGHADRFIAYVSGTRPGLGDGEAFDGESNLDLYADRTASASFAATMQALAKAGARPGDQVILGGYSQGAMPTQMLAGTSPYDVVASIDIGAPVEADLGDDVLKVSIAHDDDLVVAAQGGGLGHTTGSPDSVIISRVAQASPDLDEIGLGAHDIARYRETAAMADGSGAAQIGVVHQTLRDFTAGASVTRFAFGAERGE